MTEASLLALGWGDSCVAGGNAGAAGEANVGSGLCRDGKSPRPSPEPDSRDNIEGGAIAPPLFGAVKLLVNSWPPISEQ